MSRDIYSEMNLKYAGTGFYWQSIAVDPQGNVWEGWFNSWNKTTKWTKTERKRA
jgi:hypothetical protein